MPDCGSVLQAQLALLPEVRPSSSSRKVLSSVLLAARSKRRRNSVRASPLSRTSLYCYSYALSDGGDDVLLTRSPTAATTAAAFSRARTAAHAFSRREASSSALIASDAARAAAALSSCRTASSRSRIAASRSGTKYPFQSASMVRARDGFYSLPQFGLGGLAW